jgi:hypothetical protein
MQLATRKRRLVPVVLAGLLSALLPIGTAAPAQAAPAVGAPGYYMLVNDAYDNYQGQQHWCLSTNATTSNSGANTHFVYLVPCQSSTLAQWWNLTNGDVAGRPTHVTDCQRFGGATWELSGNATTPAGGAAGTYGAYTARTISSDGKSTHDWVFYNANLPAGSWYIDNNGPLTDGELSASSSSPEIAGTLRVYLTHSSSTTDTHVWRPWQPVVPPSSTVCANS